MIPPDLDLARRLESAEAAASRAFCETAAHVHHNLNIRAIPCAGGVGLFYGPADPLNAVKGVGLHGPVPAAKWDALEAFFRASSSPVVLDICPLADEAFITLLGERHYRIGSFETVTFREINSNLPSPPAIPACSIAPPDDPKTWGRVMDLGFADGGEPMKFVVDIGLVRARLPRAHTLLATIDGQPAGAAGFSVHEGVAHLNGAAVLPAFRRRGLQSALTTARLRLARDLGCTLAKLDVRAGSASHRNAARAGFQVAYTRPQLVRAW